MYTRQEARLALTSELGSMSQQGCYRTENLGEIWQRGRSYLLLLDAVPDEPAAGSASAEGAKATVIANKVVEKRILKRILAFVG